MQVILLIVLGSLCSIALNRLIVVLNACVAFCVVLQSCPITSIPGCAHVPRYFLHTHTTRQPRRAHLMPQQVMSTEISQQAQVNCPGAVRHDPRKRSQKQSGNSISPSSLRKLHNQEVQALTPALTPPIITTLYRLGNG